jgi:hypothetical protein
MVKENKIFESFYSTQTNKRLFPLIQQEDLLLNLPFFFVDFITDSSLATFGPDKNAV